MKILNPTKPYKTLANPKRKNTLHPKKTKTQNKPTNPKNHPNWKMAFNPNKP